MLKTNALFRKEIRDRDRKNINFEAFYIPLVALLKLVTSFSVMYRDAELNFVV